MEGNTLNIPARNSLQVILSMVIDERLTWVGVFFSQRRVPRQSSTADVGRVDIETNLYKSCPVTSYLSRYMTRAEVVATFASRNPPAEPA